MAGEDLAGGGQALPVIAVSRLRFKHIWYTFPAWIRFRRLYRDIAGHPGFVRGQVSVADPWTVVNISVWEGRRAMLEWSGLPGHIDAVRWTYGRTREVWSADWSLNRVSRSASRWEGDWPLRGTGFRAAD